MSSIMPALSDDERIAQAQYVERLEREKVALRTRIRTLETLLKEADVALVTGADYTQTLRRRIKTALES
jgi:hypothetical protein